MPFHQLFLISDTWTLNVEPKIYIFTTNNKDIRTQSEGPPQCENFFNAFLHHLEPIQKKSNLMMEWS